MSLIKGIFFRHSALIAITGILLLVIYWPSFSVPYYLDDRLSIVENSLLNQQNIAVLIEHYFLRFITYFSFWMNVQWLDGSLLSFHLVNLAIHAINGALVYQLCRFLANKHTSLSKRQIISFSFIVALIWLVHPLNTQAVTYIVQRTASLVTLFVLLTTLSYLKLRFEQKKFLWFFCLVFSITCGALTKQNFFVVFVFIVLYEAFVVETHKHKILTLLLGVFFTLAVLYPFLPTFFELLNSATKETIAITRFDYFTTQLTVIWSYILKFFYPINLQLDMGVTLAKPSTGIHFIALISHIFLIASAINLRKSLPIFTIGILWFYAGHSVESFVIPITDLAFEHRTYLPNIGLTLASCALIFYCFSKSSHLLIYCAATVVAALSVVTYHRNVQWQSPYTFYQNELALSPNSARSQESFALELIKKSELSKAQELLIKSVNNNMKQGKVTVTSLNNLMLLLFQQGNYQKGVKIAQLALRHIHRPLDKSQILTSISYGYIKMGYCDFALGLAKTALKLNPNNSRSKEYYNFCVEKVLR